MRIANSLEPMKLIWTNRSWTGKLPSAKLQERRELPKKLKCRKRKLRRSRLRKQSDKSLLERWLKLWTHLRMWQFQGTDLMRNWRFTRSWRCLTTRFLRLWVTMTKRPSRRCRICSVILLLNLTQIRLSRSVGRRLWNQHISMKFKKRIQMSKR